MAEDAKTTPRWGNEYRERKAIAILGTLVSECGEEVKAGVWLDIGCGSGGIANALAPHVSQIIGIDPEPWPCWSGMAEKTHNLSFVQAGFDSDELQMDGETADVIICNQVYEHVAQPAVLIRNIHRVLKPGGVCYFAGPNLLWPVEPHVYWPLVHWLPRRAAQSLMRALGSKQAGMLDAYSKTYWRLMSWFRKNGFESTDAVPARLSVELDTRRYKELAKIIRQTPPFGSKLVAPFWPSFIFVLRKQQL